MGTVEAEDVEPHAWSRVGEGLFVALALLAASFLLWGNAVEEMAKFLPVVHRLADPTAYPGDRDVEASMRLLNWGLLPFVPFERLGVLDGALFAGTVLARLGLAAAALALARSLSLDRWSAAGGALVVLVAQPQWGVVGQFRVIGAEPVASHVALPMGVAALAAAFSGRAALAGALAGLGANLHPMMIAAFLPALLGAVAGGADLRAGARAAGHALLAACVTATPVIVWTAANALGDLGASDPAQDLQVLRDTVGAHLFWSLSATADQAGFLGSIAAALLCLPVNAGRPEATRRLACALAAALLVITVYVALCEAGLAPLLLIKAHVLRGTQVTSVLARVLIGFAAVCALRRGDRKEVMVAVTLLCSTVGAPELLALATLARGGARWRRGGSPVWAVVGALPLALFAPTIVKGEIEGLARAMVVVLAALVLRATAARLEPLACRRWAAAPALAALGAGVVLFLAMRVSVSTASVAVATPRVAWRPERLHDPAAVDLARWAATGTPREARFLIGVDETAFLAYARRSVVVSWAVTTLSVWDLRLGRERLDRVAEVAASVSTPGLGYQLWPPAQVHALARRHAASFVVIERLPQTCRPAWELVYENPRYLVYRVP